MQTIPKTDNLYKTNKLFETNPALKRIQERMNILEDRHPQLYSRMHHRHNRS